jgi:23S rRNA (guanosine2251-2'-O)-methyltransferase
MKRLVLGPRAVSEALRAAPGRVSVVYVHEGQLEAMRELAALARNRNVALEERSREALEAIAEGGKHQGVIAIAGEYSYRSLDELLDQAGPAPLLVALDQVQDPHNFGAIVRSAVALGANGLITLKDRAAPVTPVVVRASAGATEAACIARVTNLARTLAELRERGLQVVGLAAEGEQDLRALPFPEGGRVLVVGSEGDGLRRLVREHCDVLARIALRGPLASLNASVAAGIALHESASARAASSGYSAPEHV